MDGDGRVTKIIIEDSDMVIKAVMEMVVWVMWVMWVMNVVRKTVMGLVVIKGYM
jgi:hypothetical protein